MSQQLKDENGIVNRKEYKVSDIYPIDSFTSSYPIEIVNRKHSPIKDLEFNYKVDKRNVKTDKTDENGMLSIKPRPVNEVLLSLPS